MANNKRTDFSITPALMGEAIPSIEEEDESESIKSESEFKNALSDLPALEDQELPEVSDSELFSPPATDTPDPDQLDQETPNTPASSRQDSREKLGGLPPEVWLLIRDVCVSEDDVFRLSCVNKSFLSLLLAERALYETKLDHNRVAQQPSALHLTIKLGWPLYESERVIKVYKESGNIHLLRGRRSQFIEPPLHLAARMNRIDVVELLLQYGCGINTRWGGHWNSCPAQPHEECDDGTTSCKNALCVARNTKNYEMAELLLMHGIEDMDQDELGPTVHGKFCRQKKIAADTTSWHQS
ncbi:hypothetical protein F5Y19DRAFT_478442 [Xylariaceae sp. FL1651]|nr:hypothetical protein F5Y19DRAFT_478442 [Xylariaceae sp. FL1651]